MPVFLEERQAKGDRELISNKNISEDKMFTYNSQAIVLVLTASHSDERVLLDV